MEQFRWFTGGWGVNAELPVPASFEVASRTVREQDVAAQVPCGPDVGRHVAGIRQFEAAGFTHVALVQVGADTQQTPNRHPRTMHHLGGNAPAAHPPNVLTGLTNHVFRPSLPSAARDALLVLLAGAAARFHPLCCPDDAGGGIAGLGSVRNHTALSRGCQCGRPVCRPENRHPPRNVPSSER
jgi:hypothetical protein